MTKVEYHSRWSHTCKPIERPKSSSVGQGKAKKKRKARGHKWVRRKRSSTKSGTRNLPSIMMLETLASVTAADAVGTNDITNAIANATARPTVRPDSCANRTYIPTHAGFFSKGYTGTTNVNVSLASGKKSVKCNVGTAVIPIVADDGYIRNLELPDALESDSFNHTLVSQRQLYRLYGSQQVDNPDDTMTIFFLNGDTTTLDVVNGVYHYRTHGASTDTNHVVQSITSDTSVDDIIGMLSQLAADLSSEASSRTVTDEKSGPSPVLEHYHHALGHLHYRGVIQFM